MWRGSNGAITRPISRIVNAEKRRAKESGVVGIWVAQNIANKQRNFVGHKFWARGYFVSTVGINEKVIRAYIENQEKEDKRLDDLFDR